MGHKMTGGFTAFLTHAAAVLLLTAGVWAGNPEGALPESKQGAAADENFFLARALEGLYERWPSNASAPEQYAAEAAELRKTALRLRQRIQSEPGLEKELAARYTDFIGDLDSHASFLANIDSIKAGAAQKLQRDSFESGYTGGKVGAATFAALSQSENVTWGEAAAASLIAGGLTYAIDAWNKSGARDDAQRRAVEAEAKALGDKIQSSLMRAQATVRSIAKKRGWKASEIGWELSDEHAQTVLRLLKSQDWPALAKITERQCALRPRDPFPRLSLSYFRALSAPNIDTLAGSAADCFAASLLIPYDGVYNDYRLTFVSLAAWFASRARSLEISNGKDVTGSTKTGEMAVLLWRRVLEISPSDASGELRESLAFALMNVNSLNEALKHANEIRNLRQKNPNFCYDYACLSSRVNAPDKALGWLESSINLGMTDISWMRRDPDLENVRRNHSKEFAELVNPKWGWFVSYGWFWDDVSLINKSAFPLTNVKLNVRISYGEIQKTLNLTCERIEAGESQCWSNVVDACGNWGSAAKATVSCDQQK